MHTTNPTNQTSHEDLNLELTLGPPSSSSLPPPPPQPPPVIPRTFTSSGHNILSPTLTPPRQLERAVIKIPHASTSSHNPSVPPPPPQPNPRPRRKRTKRDDTLIEPPYPWSTPHQAVVHKLDYLRANGIVEITGEVKCSRCDEKYEMVFDLEERLNEIENFINNNWDILHDRAPECWKDPKLEDCKKCKQNKCVRPVIPENDNQNINWLFLLLGQFLGCLKLEQLKYFCAQTNIHRTGAKNRLLYLTYFALFKQLNPAATQPPA